MRIPFRTRPRAREEALAWLARLKRGLRQGEGPELLAWLRRRSHRTLIAKAAVEWHGPEALAILSELFPIDPAILEPRRGTHPAIMAAAAAIAVCITLLPVELGVLHHFGLLGGPFNPWYTTTLKETKRLALTDGTRVALNRGTRISVIYGEHFRSAFIVQGEALFTIKSDRYRPFDVRAAGRDFETTSATFDVSLTGQNRLSVIVLTGTVKVFPPRSPPDGSPYSESDPGMYEPILIEPLQMLSIEPDEQTGRRLTEQDVHARLAWQAGT
ncbi:MAG: FecR domain-containing protein [Steroidobacteraceae bacterium]